MSKRELQPVGPFSLGQSIQFLEGFTPAAYEATSSDRLSFAFIGDEAFRQGGTEHIAGALIWEEGGVIVVDTHGAADPDVTHRQIERILSLDIDGRGFADVGRRDPVVGRLQTRYPGLRPVLFFSPYEAAAWAIIGNRIRITQAAQIKARLAEELGAKLSLEGVTEHAFPGPSRLAELDSFPGLTARKVDYLKQLAVAAPSGILDAARLRLLPVEQALGDLQTLPGIGPFGAELILIRGAGVPDHLATHEPRLARAVARAYGLTDAVSEAKLATIAEGWRPYRAWVTLLLRARLEAETGEISGRSRHA